MKTLYIIVALALAGFAATFLIRAHYEVSDTKSLTQTQSYGNAETGVGAEAVSKEDIKITKADNIQKTMKATLHTNKGDITIEFDAVNAPNTAANFVKLAKTGFYDGVKFHRVIKGFMIQGGDPLSKDDALMSRWGTGGPGYTFEDEITPDNRNDIGTISMANSGPDTNGSQFFINTANNNFLDTKHTVFGHVVDGMDAVRAIESTPTGPNDRPVDPVVIKSISF
jgi:cyclophilin family peptidyl-prolyl cis-trans isomerase